MLDFLLNPRTREVVSPGKPLKCSESTFAASSTPLDEICQFIISDPSGTPSFIVNNWDGTSVAFIGWKKQAFLLGY